MRILIAEDDAFSRRFLRKNLEKWGFEVDEADDGLCALQMLGEPDAPRLAIVDWMMPGLDGLDLCRRLRQTQQTRQTYVIMLTAKLEPEDLAQAMAAGADDFATKSFDLRELQLRLRAGERIVRLTEELERLTGSDNAADLIGVCEAPEVRT